jgi:hypothetical protein
LDSPLEATEMQAKDERAVEEESVPGERDMPCPVCGHPMPDLKGGKDTICQVCGFKDSCCY